MLKHGILGLLNYGDMTGYEIREAFQDSLNFFWSAQTSQIYREITLLEENGWITRHTVSQTGKPSKNICSITRSGREELHRWLEAPMDEFPLRSPTLMKTFFLGELPTSESLEFFRTLRQTQWDQLAQLRKTDASISQYSRQVPEGNSALFWQMTADFGRRYQQMYLQWIDHCIHLLEHGEE